MQGNAETAGHDTVQEEDRVQSRMIQCVISAVSLALAV